MRCSDVTDVISITRGHVGGMLNENNTVKCRNLTILLPRLFADSAFRSALCTQAYIISLQRCTVATGIPPTWSLLLLLTEWRHCHPMYSRIASTFRQHLKQGRRLKGIREIVPLKYLGGGGGYAFIPQSVENVIASCHGERDWEEEKQKIRHQWPTRKLVLSGYWFICRHIQW